MSSACEVVNQDGDVYVLIIIDTENGGCRRDCLHMPPGPTSPLPVSPDPQVWPPYPAEGLLPQLLDDEVSSSRTAVAALGVDKAEQCLTGHLLCHHRDSAGERAQEHRSGRDLWAHHNQSLSVLGSTGPYEDKIQGLRSWLC